MGNLLTWTCQLSISEVASNQMYFCAATPPNHVAWSVFQYIYQSNSPSCKANSNCHTNILLKPCATLMMTKLRDSAVFVPPSCTPLSETLELSNKQDRRGGSPSLEFSSPRVILHAGLVWLRACGSRCGGRTVEGPSPALPALLPTC